MDQNKESDSGSILKDCNYCAKILDVFNVHVTDEFVGLLGTVASVLSQENDCPGHTKMLDEAISQSEEMRQEYGIEPKYPDRSQDPRVIRLIKYAHESSVEFDLQDGDETIPLALKRNLIWRQEQEAHQGNGFLLNQTNIDPKLLKRWKRECEKSHSKCKAKGRAIRPLLLVDTTDRCLVSSEGIQDSFVALSYCWGTPERGRPYWFRNQKAILNDLKQPNSLAFGSEYLKRLPATIRDSIELTQILGERYIWIDSLCVVQDDDDMKNIEIPKMSEIYASAELIIVAAEGLHADFGLPGFSFSKPRVIDQEVTQLGIETLISPIGYLFQRESLDQEAGYHMRGWTFQEFVFGRKRLILEEQSVRWECREASWCEDTKDTIELDYLDNSWDTESLPDSGVLELDKLINGYNQRSLSRSEDAFPAWCGFQRALIRSYPQGFINGMPINFFDIAMSWLPFSTNVKRRETAQCLLNPPSWSWLGWRGRVDISFSGDNCLLKDQSFRSLHVSKLVDWFAIFDSDSPMVPILESAQKDENFSLALEPSLLYCKTEGATLRFAEPLFEDEFDLDMNGPWFVLRDSTGLWCGVLRLHSIDDRKDDGFSIEVVAISRGHAPDIKSNHPLYGLTEWHATDRPRIGEIYSYHNVLWVRRKGNIAYRIASGRISHDRWIKQQRKTVDLYLG
jgi:hypothetical protein